MAWLSGRGGSIEHGMCVLIFSTTFEVFLILGGIQRDMIIKVLRFLCKVAVFLVGF
jgi:hypothetical protein